MKKDLMDMLGQPDETELERLAENSPLPDEAMKKRIVRACLEKAGEAPEEQAADTAGGTEIYRRPRWAAYTAAAAAFAIIAVSGAGILLIGKNMKKTAPASIESGSDVITAPAPEPFQEIAASSGTAISDTDQTVTGTKITVTAYVAGANETSTTAADTSGDVPEPDDVEPTTGNAPVDESGNKETPTAAAPAVTEPDIQDVTDPVDEPSKSSTENDQQTHFPNIPNNDPGPSAYFIGTFYWNSSGSLGNMSWSFSAGANAGQQGSSSGVGQCAKDGDYYGDFSYTASNGQITITWASGKLACTSMKGTISGILYNSTVPFDIVWNSGGTDHFTYNTTGGLGITTSEPYFTEKH
ncbi:MAG: hypothetical protein IJK31_04310 [Ruminococcus sp.]|nr:hypothetical protein [Ruminococcus sp.]